MGWSIVDHPEIHCSNGFGPSELMSIFAKYAHILLPVMDGDGNVVAAEFPHEAGLKVSAIHGFSNIHQHMSDKYFIMLDEDDQHSFPQPRIKKSLIDSRQRVLPSAPPRCDIARILAKACAIGSLPLSMSMNPGILYFARSLCPGIVMPVPSTVTMYVDKYYAEELDSARRDIAALRDSSFGKVTFALATDMWTSVSGNGHLGITAFLIDSSFVLRTFTLGCSYLASPHTAPRIAGQVLATLESFGVASTEVIAITTDSASTALCSTHLIGGALTATISCASHMICLCLREAGNTPTFSVALQSVVEVVNFFVSPKRLEALKKKQTELILNVKRFIPVCRTRWNFMSDVIGRCIENQTVIRALQSSELGITGAPEIANWISMQEKFEIGITALKFGHPLIEHAHQAIQKLSCSTSVTLSSVFPTAWSLYEEGDQLSSSDSTVCREFSTKFRDEIDQRFFYTETARLYQTSEILDPTTMWKKLKSAFTEEHKKETAKVRDDIRRVFFPPLTQSQPSTPSVDILGEPGIIDEPSIQDVFNSQFRKYLGFLYTHDAPANCLTWWKEHHHMFPAIAYVARCILCAQASSGEVERLFSTGAYVEK